VNEQRLFSPSRHAPDRSSASAAPLPKIESLLHRERTRLFLTGSKVEGYLSSIPPSNSRPALSSWR